MTDKKSQQPVLEVVKGAKPAGPAKTVKTGGGGGKSSGTPEKFGKYTVKNGCFYLVKVDRDGNDVETLLTNITAKVVEFVSLKNGLEETGEWHIQGYRADGRALPLAKVPDSVFSQGQQNWLNKHWGPNVILEPGAATTGHHLFLATN